MGGGAEAAAAEGPREEAVPAEVGGPGAPRSRILLRSSLVREIRSLSSRIRERVEGRIDGLGENPRPPDVKRLEGGEGRYRVRVGDWRVLHVVDDTARVVVVVKVGHRGGVYRRR